ncbi:precorrin-6A synthase (deacetylating) [Nocardioides lentus]|uniref:Precorrin-6A synthase (Deacetylating) n=1 Tax=Nocardioides lentus TaxID=338077 RepID=A0ABN2PJ07_9ACTN
MSRTIRVVGMGMGPDHLTPEATRALAASSYVVAARKHRGSDERDPLLAVRAAVAAGAGLAVVEVPDPPRGRTPADYRGEVADWHAARAEAWGAAISARDGDPALLVWGDPSLYDSTIRVVDAVAARLGARVEVVAGVAAPQLLAARHGVVLHAVGEPVLLTTGRRLARDLAAGTPNVVVMLDGDLACLDPGLGLQEWTIRWGANLGTPSERLVAGRVREVADDLRAARAAARETAGWVLDTYLLRAPAPF